MHRPDQCSTALARTATLLLGVASGFAAAAPAPEASVQGPGEDLTRLSLAELANLDVTSVSKASEALQRAPATIYVITHEAILRSGATSVIEALRLAPNLLVQQRSASAYTISARGLAGNDAAQNFSNKLLILIDGRSVYTPLYSGIYANTVDVMLEDIDRIEVISGVGETLWGANAMNGIINIITRASYLTQGTALDAGAGNGTQFVDGRLGGQLGAAATARAYAFGFHRGSEQLAGGATAGDGWNKGQAGFRADWSFEGDSLTLQGDLFRGTEGVIGSSRVGGGNLLARYTHRTDRSDLQLQAYDDQTEQFGGGAQSGGFVVHTYDLQLQQTLQAGSAHRLIWGAGERVYAYGITDSAQLLWAPPSRNLTLGNLFAQDAFELSGRARLVYGLKLEDDPYAGWSALPSARLSYALSDRETLWASAARGIRSPTPFDEDVVERFDGLVALRATGHFRPESAIGYELGVRGQPLDALSFTIAPFYDVYDHLRTVDATPGTFFPLSFGNSMQGAVFGLDSWAEWEVRPGWRLSPGLTWVRERLYFKATSPPQPLGTVQAGNDPSVRASLKSGIDLPHALTLDLFLRYVGALPDPSLTHDYELDARLGWQVTPNLGLSLNGANLLHARHLEVPLPPDEGEEILRSVLAEVRWKF